LHVVAELAVKGMMELPSLPPPKMANGTWIYVEMRHNIILSLITWNDKWGPRYHAWIKNHDTARM
jgi:hypothetical protein